MENIEALLKAAAAGRELLAWSPTGSHMYGLATPASDLDFSAIVEGRKFSRQIIDGDLDMRFYTPEQLLELLFDARISEVDMLMAGRLRYTSPTYRDLFKKFRFNSNKYYRNSDSFAFQQAQFIERHPDITERRSYKALKAALRAAILAHRALRQGEAFTSLFTAEEATAYWAALARLQRTLESPQDPQSIMALLHHEALSAQ
jgi:hypothetical protein